MRTRPHLLWLLGPFVLYLGAVPLVNRVEPTVGGVPFLFCWLLLATLLTPPMVWLAHRGDRRRQRERLAERAECTDGQSGDGADSGDGEDGGDGADLGDGRHGRGDGNGGEG